MAKKEKANPTPNFSDTYYRLVKKKYLDGITSIVREVLIQYNGGNGQFFQPFFPPPFHNSNDFNYFLIEDLDDSVRLAGLDQLVTKLFSEFSAEDNICALFNGNTENSVKYYICRGSFNLQGLMEFGDIVGINHIIFFPASGERFKFTEDGKNIVLLKQK